AAPRARPDRSHSRRRRSESSRDQPAPGRDHAAAAAETTAPAPPTTPAPTPDERPTPPPAPNPNAKPNTNDQLRSEAIRAGCHASPSRCGLLVRNAGLDSCIIPARGAVPLPGGGRAGEKARQRGSHTMTFVDPGGMGECDARTQEASICRHTGATADAAARRRARPGDTTFIV